MHKAGCDEQILAMIRSMYRRVVRRILIRDQVSEDFQVDLGVPQGAVLSPYLYAQYINGLHAALRQKGLGIWVHGRLVPLLFYADDIVLLADTEDRLQESMRVVDEFARKWRFSVNHGKSNVVVFGSKQARAAAGARTWMLGGASIKATDSYKYLGLDFTAAVSRGKWNTMAQRLHSNAKAASSLLRFQGGGANGLRPRTMIKQWEAICRPVLEYGCEIWQGEISKAWVDRLESVQNKFGRAIMGIQAFPAAVAVRADLGLHTLRSRRQMLKLLYWGKLCNTKSNRLLAHVFKSRRAQVIAGGGALSSLVSFRSCLAELDLSYVWLSASCPGDWPSLVRQHIRDHNDHIYDHAVDNSASLSLYRHFNARAYPRVVHPYLDDRYNIPGTRLKSYLRMGAMWTMSRVASCAGWPASGGACLLCRSGSVEDSAHFLLSCPSLRLQRVDFHTILAESLSSVGVAGVALLRHYRECLRTRPLDALALLAGHMWYSPCPANVEVDVHEEMSAKALWLFDKVSKNYLLRCWRARQNIVGTITVQRGRVEHGCGVRSGSPLAPPAALSRGVFDPRLRHCWMAWVEKHEVPVAHTRSGKPKGFYAVTKGRVPGIYYTWSDAFATVAGFPGARVKGFDSLHEATQVMSSDVLHPG